MTRNDIALSSPQNLNAVCEGARKFDTRNAGRLARRRANKAIRKGGKDICRKATLTN